MSNPFNYSVFERSMLLDLNPRMDTGQREENASIHFASDSIGGEAPESDVF
jgi:hypothetical protein